MPCLSIPRVHANTWGHVRPPIFCNLWLVLAICYAIHPVLRRSPACSLYHTPSRHPVLTDSLPANVGNGQAVPLATG